MSSFSSTSASETCRRAIIPVFLPGVGCPQRCIFCNQEIVTDVSEVLPPQHLEQHVAKCLGAVRRDKFGGINVAFYGGSFTALPLSRQKDYLNVLHGFADRGEIDSIRISTRPDFIDAERLELLRSHLVRVIELGVQSMDEEVLALSRRGYTASIVRRAAQMVHEYEFDLGIHLMLGLPGDTVEKALRSSDEVIALRPHFVRIHPTLVLRDTELARMYQQGDYAPWEPETIIETATELLRRFESAGIRVARIGLQTSAGLLNPENIIAGYTHPALKELCESRLFFEQCRRRLFDTKDSILSQAVQITFLVNPKDLSKAVGHKKENLKKLCHLTIGRTISFRADARILRGEVAVAFDKGRSARE